MFSSSNSMNPFFHFSPSNFTPSSFFLPQNENKNASDGIFQSPKKNSKRKDRHSKIYTAHGLRDRRVRLSIGISRKFFKLQDMLGFEKASETISWLLKNSESSIKELEHKEFSNNESNLENIAPISGLCEGELGTIGKIKEKKINNPRRESRARARERARERTREKTMNTQKIGDRNPSIPNRSDNLVSEFEACEEMVGDVGIGFSANPKFENHLITHKDWDKTFFAEYEVLSRYFETCHH